MIMAGKAIVVVSVVVIETMTEVGAEVLIGTKGMSVV
jgi:hypothetical protein